MPNNLKNLIDQFINMDDKIFSYFVRCITNGRSIYLNALLVDLDQNHLDLFTKLRDAIIELIDQDTTKDEDVVDILSKYGLETSLSRGLYDYCQSIRSPLKDSEAIQTISPDTFESVVKFVVNKIFLYNDYNDYFINSLESMLNLKNVRQTKQLVRFIHFYVNSVSSRTISPDMLKLKLQSEIGIPENLCNIFYNCITEHIEDLHQAYLLSQINSVDTKLDNLYKLFEDFSEDESEDIEE